MDEIWERLDRASEKDEWNDMEDRYEQAKGLSQPAVRLMHEKIEKYINSKN